MAHVPIHVESPEWIVMLEHSPSLQSFRVQKEGDMHAPDQHLGTHKLYMNTCLTTGEKNRVSDQDV